MLELRNKLLFVVDQFETSAVSPWAKWKLIKSRLESYKILSIGLKVMSISPLGKRTSIYEKKKLRKLTHLKIGTKGPKHLF